MCCESQHLPLQRVDPTKSLRESSLVVAAVGNEFVVCLVEAVGFRVLLSVSLLGHLLNFKLLAELCYTEFQMGPTAVRKHANGAGSQ
eukprot:3506208-Amphidinium_carterae.1